MFSTKRAMITDARGKTTEVSIGGLPTFRSAQDVEVVISSSLYESPLCNGDLGILPIIIHNRCHGHGFLHAHLHAQKPQGAIDPTANAAGAHYSNAFSIRSPVDPSLPHDFCVPAALVLCIV